MFICVFFNSNVHASMAYLCYKYRDHSISLNCLLICHLQTPKRKKRRKPLSNSRTQSVFLLMLRRSRLLKCFALMLSRYSSFRRFISEFQWSWDSEGRKGWRAVVTEAADDTGDNGCGAVDHFKGVGGGRLAARSLSVFTKARKSAVWKRASYRCRQRWSSRHTGGGCSGASKVCCSDEFRFVRESLVSLVF